LTKLKLGPLPDDKSVKVMVELPGPLHRDLMAATAANICARWRSVSRSRRRGSHHGIDVGTAANAGGRF
jgi:hypothetical protein